MANSRGKILNNKSYLFINTINPVEPGLVLFSEEGEILKKQKFTEKQEELPGVLMGFLKSAKIKKERIKGILVYTGPGSFSGSRAGVVIANAFNFIYEIPVVGIRAGEGNYQKIIADNCSKFKKAGKKSRAKVYYAHEPNITVSRKPRL